MLFFSLILFIIYLAYLLYEYHYNEHIKKSFYKIILVNGIRGKTSTSMQIDAILRENGYRVFTKTTGSEPAILDCNHSHSIIKRRGAANIIEQIKILKEAYRQKAEIVIIECMAIDPDLQHVLQHRIIKSNILVVTNIRPDHIPEMGKDLDEIAYALSRTIPQNGLVYTTDKKYLNGFRAVAEKNNSTVRFVDNAEFDTLKLAKELCRDLILEDKPDYFFKSPSFSTVDNKKYLLKNTNNQIITFINLFSVNDPISTKYWLDHYLNDNNCYSAKYIVYNNRSDRPNRVKLYSTSGEMFNPFDKLFICGENTYLAQRIFKQSLSIEPVRQKTMSFLYGLEDNAIIFGIGNEKGMGNAFIERLNSGVMNG